CLTRRLREHRDAHELAAAVEPDAEPRRRVARGIVVPLHERASLGVRWDLGDLVERGPDGLARWAVPRAPRPPALNVRRQHPAPPTTTRGTHTTTRRRRSGEMAASIRRASSSDGAVTSTHRVGAVTRAQYSAQLAMLWISRQGRGAGSGSAASRRQRGTARARRARERRLHFGDRLLLAIAYPVGGIERTAESETRSRSPRIGLLEAEERAPTTAVRGAQFLRVPRKILSDFLTRFSGAA